MKKFKVAALAVAAAAALAACAPEAPLAMTGEPLTYLDGISVRDGLVAQYLAGDDVADELAETCYDLSVLHNIYLDDQWKLDCANPEFGWNADTDTWVLVADLPNYS